MSPTIRFFAFRVVAGSAVLGSAGLIVPASTQAQFTSQHQALLNHHATSVGGGTGTIVIPFADLDFRDQVDGERALLGQGNVSQGPRVESSQIGRGMADLAVDGARALLARRDEPSISNE